MFDQEKLCEAINRGFISVHADGDGILRYRLTKNGEIKWLQEKIEQQENEEKKNQTTEV